MANLKTGEAFDMSTLSASSLSYIFDEGERVSQTSSNFSVRYTDVEFGYTETLVFKGTLGGYSNGFPTTGTVTSFDYLIDTDAAIQIAGMSLAVSDLTAYIQEDDVQGLFADILSGNDVLTGSSFNDYLSAFDGDDKLSGGAGTDRLNGGGGNDLYMVNSSSDRAIEAVGGGTDSVRSTATFTLGGNVENLTLTGIANIGGTGNGLANKVIGNGGANTLNGGGGKDQLTGGAGADKFLFDALLRAANVDDILDFSAADDTIRLDRTVFTNILADGTLARAAFVAGTAAVDAADRIVYDQATGNIFYDSDGNGAAAKILFAHVDPGTVLTNADFFAVI